MPEQRIVMEPARQDPQRLLDLMALMRDEREIEKTRTARRLHDEVGQALAAFRMQCYALDIRLRAVNPEAADDLQSALCILDEAISTVREVSEELRPGSLRMGVDAAIELYAEQFQSQSDIACVADIENGSWLMDEHRAIELFRIFEEALANARQHAGVTMVEVNLRKDGDDALLEIRGDGGAPEVAESNVRELRMLTMNERAIRAGGVFTIAGSGTIEVRMPLNK